MDAPSPRRSMIKGLMTLIGAFGVAAVGGSVFHLLGFPAAWVSGATVAIAIAALFKMPVEMPNRLRDGVFVLLGISMGSGVSPETVERLPHWPISLMLLAVTVVGVTLSTTLFFRWVARWSWRTALFASVPGAMSYVIALAVETNADLRRVSIAQTVRLMMLIVALPVAIAGIAPAAGVVVPPIHTAGPIDMAILLVVGTAAGLAAHKLRVPAGLLTGAFLSSALLHGAGIVTTNLPQWVLIPCFLAIGIVIGERFKGTDLDMLRQALVASLGGFVVGTTFAGLGVIAVIWLTDIEFGQAALAFAPGGLEAMIALSFALAVDPAFVAAHQLFRFVAIALAMPAVMGALERRFGSPKI